MTKVLCKGCSERPPVANSDFCLACLNSPKPTVNEDDPVVENSLATNLPTGRRLCEECGAPARPINRFGKPSYYLCLNEKCGHKSATTRDTTPWPRMTPDELQDQHPTRRREP